MTRFARKLTTHCLMRIAEILAGARCWDQDCFCWECGALGCVPSRARHRCWCPCAQGRPLAYCVCSWRVATLWPRATVNRCVSQWSQSLHLNVGLAASADASVQRGSLSMHTHITWHEQMLPRYEIKIRGFRVCILYNCYIHICTFNLFIWAHVFVCRFVHTHIYVYILIYICVYILYTYIIIYIYMYT